MATSDEVRPDPGDDSAPRLSVAAVARRLGMAPSTLRTWDRRYGLGPTYHQAGSHRRYTPVDLKRLVLMRRLTLEGVQPAEAARIAKSVARARAVPSPRVPSVPSSSDSTSAAAGPRRSRSRRPLGPSVPAGVVGLPIVDPPPRGVPGDPSSRTARAAGEAEGPGGAAGPGAAVEPAALADPSPRPVPTTSQPEATPASPGLCSCDQSLAVGGVQLGGSSGPGGRPGARKLAELGAWPRTGGGRQVLALAEGCAQARGLARAAMALDSPEMWRILDHSLAREGVLTTWDRLAVPVLQAIGERWRTTQEVVEVEHLFSETLVDVLRSVVSRCLPPPRPNPVLLACLDTERHTLPLHALAAALAERGVSTRMLGAGLPAPSLVAAVRRTGPALVFLYAQLPAGEHEVLAELRRQRPAPQLVLGGPGWPRQQPGAARVVGSLQGALNVALSAVRG